MRERTGECGRRETQDDTDLTRQRKRKANDADVELLRKGEREGERGDAKRTLGVPHRSRVMGCAASVHCSSWQHGLVPSTGKAGALCSPPLDRKRTRFTFFYS